MKKGKDILIFFKRLFYFWDHANSKQENPFLQAALCQTVVSRKLLHWHHAAKRSTCRPLLHHQNWCNKILFHSSIGLKLHFSNRKLWLYFCSVTELNSHIFTESERVCVNGDPRSIEGISSLRHFHRIYLYVYYSLSLYIYIYTLINVIIYEKIQYTFTHMIV